MRTLFSYHPSVAAPSSHEDGLFSERLDTFMQKILADVRAFSIRESQSYEETRRYVAQWHARYLFQPTSIENMPQQSSSDRLSLVRDILCNVSSALEELANTAGVQAFVLAVDPYDQQDGGFLGGSAIGQDFWRGLRGGGDPGARSFKTHCIAKSPDPVPNIPSQSSEPPVPDNHPQKNIHPSQAIKNELYERVRIALRTASGSRTAEMKWSNPERLDMYGVRLVGWPADIPVQNPSTLKVGQNKVLLEAIRDGSMRFERIYSATTTSEGASPTRESGGSTARAEEDFSWAYDADGGTSPAQERSAVAKHNSEVTAGEGQVQDQSAQSVQPSQSRKRQRSQGPD